MKKPVYLLVSVFILLSCSEKKSEKLEVIAKKEPIIKDFGLTFNDFYVTKDTIRTGDTFSTLIENYELNNLTVHQVTEKVKDSFDVKSLKTDKPYFIFSDKKNHKDLKYFVYVKDKTSYLLLNLKDSLTVQVVKRPTTLKRRTIAASIEGSLSETLEREGVSAAVAPKLASIYAYTIDFFKTKRGDKFAITIIERYIQDTIYDGVETIEAAYFEYKGKKKYAFPYQLSSSKVTEYYDEEGRGLKNMFLKAPLDYFRISSRFSGRRFHPVQLTWKAHNGTDYAAPHGTPIKTTASGVVERTGYTSGNGNFVKVKHNGTYATQYLHMSKILVRQGQRVSQGQTIGRVGSTGLATGPHVCYRFWKNGVQVDPLRLNLPNTTPMDKRQINGYLAKIKPLKEELDSATADKFK